MSRWLGDSLLGFRYLYLAVGLDRLAKRLFAVMIIPARMERSID